MEEIKNNIPIHTREAWDKLYTRLQDGNLIPEEQTRAKTASVYSILRIAAVALILLGAGLALYLNMNRKPEVAMLKLNTVNETATLIKTLEDGSVIYLAQNSFFSFPAGFKPGSRTVELKGEAFFDVTPNPSRPFIIETDEALIQVLGTAFNVNTGNGNGFELSVDRGKVKVTLKKDPSKSEMVQAGEKISNQDNSLVRSKHFADKKGPWYTKRMLFKDEKLRDIIIVLNRNFNTNFVLANNEIGKHMLTVTFQDETAGIMTELICTALNLKSQTVNGAVVLTEVKEDAKPN